MKAARVRETFNTVIRFSYFHPEKLFLSGHVNGEDFTVGDKVRVTVMRLQPAGKLRRGAKGKKA